MNCQQCNQEITSDSKYCPYCGSPVIQQVSTVMQQQSGKSIQFSDIANKINAVAGIDAPLEIKFKEVFSKLFEKHTEDDAEELFFVGTSKTTPTIENMVDSWPRPWLFARIFIIVGLLYLGMYIGVDIFQAMNFLPGLITLGSFMVPLTILIFFWEMNVPQNISIYKVVKILFGGGVLSLVAAIFLYQFTDSSSTIMIGIVEEAAKLLVVLWFLRNPKYKYIFNGLLIGAAVGTGFAAFESAGYALRIALSSGDLNLSDMYSTIMWRGVLAPGGHIVWAALSGAAVCMVKGAKSFAWSMLKDIRFLRIFVIVVVLHALWDSPWFAEESIPFAQLLFTFISWIIAFGVMNLGLKQISSLKVQNVQNETVNLPVDDSHQPNITG